MRGSIRKRGSTYTIYWDDYSEGKRKQKSKGGYKKQKEAEKALNEIINLVEKGDYIEPSKQSLKDYLLYWVENYGKSNWAPTSLQRNLGIINLYIIPTLGNVKLDKLHPTKIQETYTKALKTKEDGGYGLSSTTVEKIHKILNQSFKQAIEWQIITKNPVEAVKKPKAAKSNINALTENDSKKLLELIADTRFYLAVFIALNTGMRKGEILGLKWSDIDFINKKISITRGMQKAFGKVYETTPKTSTGNRSIALSDKMIDELKRYKVKQNELKLLLGPLYVDNGYVVCKEDGTSFDPTNFTRDFRTLTQKHGYNLKFHDLRHTHATLLLRAGIHPKMVSERLGHANISLTLNTYSHVLPDMQKQVAEMMDKIL